MLHDFGWVGISRILPVTRHTTMRYAPKHKIADMFTCALELGSKHQNSCDAGIRTNTTNAQPILWLRVCIIFTSVCARYMLSAYTLCIASPTGKTHICAMSLLLFWTSHSRWWQVESKSELEVVGSTQICISALVTFDGYTFFVSSPLDVLPLKFAAFLYRNPPPFHTLCL